MATYAQIEANRNNAAGSTGPNTDEGKSISSRNAVSHGLFSARNILNESEADEFDELAAAMRKDLSPEGILEQTLANEITRAAWRLRRCARVEDSLFETGVVRPYPSNNSGADACRGQADPDLDPMENLVTGPVQIAVDRARLQTCRILHRTIAELRRLQNERRFRIEVLPEEFDTSDLGLTSYKDLMPAMADEKRWQMNKRKVEGLDSFENMLTAATAPPAPLPPAAETKRSQSAPARVIPGTPRNAPCPCGSGEKHKRCCGKNSPPVLYGAAA